MHGDPQYQKDGCPQYGFAMSQQSQFKVSRHRFDSGALGSALVDLNAIESRNNGFHRFWNRRPKRHEREQFIAWISFVAGAVADRIGIAFSYHFKWTNETTEIWIFEGGEQA